MVNSSVVRISAVAGSFYPADQKELAKEIKQYLNKAKTITDAGQLRILIVPHAGLVYSGPTAAWGFKQLVGQPVAKVILLGSSHLSYFSGAAIDDSDIWQTPLGKIRIDADLANRLTDPQQGINLNLAPHLEEHSLEMEAIFLQTVLPQAVIVPILLGDIDQDSLDKLAQKIALNFDASTLFIISSDLSHYPPEKVAHDSDQRVIKAIINGDPDLFHRTIVDLEKQELKNLQTAACGQQAIKVGLKVAQLLQIKDIRQLNYATSADSSGDQSRVVGYGAVAAFSPRLDYQQEALQIARLTLESYLKTKKIPDLKAQNWVLQQPAAAFVTLRINDQLRGCIGQFEANQPLYKVIQSRAIAAAAADPRFEPVSVAELKNLKIEISILTPPRQIFDWHQIELGKHGVIIEKGHQGGTYLPQVATETGWTLEEFLSSLCSEKAGLPSDCYKDPDTKISVYSAIVFTEE